MRAVFIMQKSPLAKTGGILLKLPAEFNGMGFSPHPSRLYYLWRATFPQGKAERLVLMG